MKSNVEWQSWGAVDPMYGVSSLSGRSKHGSHPWTADEFYSYGEVCWEYYVPLWKRYGLLNGVCLEIGCGAGRMTKALAHTFSFVHAVDVSADMIAHAREHIDCGNVEFHLTTGTKTDVTAGVAEAAFSTDVFQHFPGTVECDNYFREIFRVLRPGGTLMVHLPVHQWPGHPMQPRLFDWLYGFSIRWVALKDTLQRLLIRFGRPRPFMTGTSYALSWVFSALPAIGFERIEAVTIAVPDALLAGPAGTVPRIVEAPRNFRTFVFATKPLIQAEQTM